MVYKVAERHHESLLLLYQILVWSFVCCLLYPCYAGLWIYINNTISSIVALITIILIAMLSQCSSVFKAPVDLLRYGGYSILIVTSHVWTGNPIVTTTSKRDEKIADELNTAHYCNHHCCTYKQYAIIIYNTHICNHHMSTTITEIQYIEIQLIKFSNLMLLILWSLLLDVTFGSWLLSLLSFCFFFGLTSPTWWSKKIVPSFHRFFYGLEYDFVIEFEMWNVFITCH